MTSSGIQLGFLEEADPAWLEARFFPSKVGGKPIWINPKDLPTPGSMACGQCSYPLCFLMQIYSPLSISKNTHHRMIYVFCCRRGSCLKKNPQAAFRVLRSQLPAENPFYEDSQEDYEDMDEPPIENTQSTQYLYRKKHSKPLCSVCGQFGDKKCSSCFAFSYCSVEHQKLHWTIGKHSKFCKELSELKRKEIEANLKNLNVTANASSSPSSLSSHEGAKPWIEGNPVLFPVYDIITEYESILEQKKNKAEEGKVKKMLDQYYSELEEEKKSGDNENVDFKDDDDMPKNVHDEEYVKFQTCIAIDSEQVIRYTTEPNSKPLWICKDGILSPENVPKCQLCGSERIFELQILPQLIYHLKVERNLVSGDPSEEIDWGNLVIYTCKNSCQFDVSAEPNNTGSYAVEYIYHQKFE